MGKAYDREAWAAGQQAKLAQAREALDDGLTALLSGDDWKRALEAMSVAGALSVLRFSFTNALLVQLQRPGTQLAGTFEAWKRVGRFVRKGEKALTVLRPAVKSKQVEEKDDAGEVVATREDRRLVGFRPHSVFALDQTEGEALASFSVPDLIGEEAFPGAVEQLRTVALAIEGDPVSSIELRPRMPGDHPAALGWYNRASRAIVVVTEDRSRAAIFKTLVHEVAHALLHGLSDHHSSPVREVEAESVAFIVSHALGLETGDHSFPYVASWAQGGAKEDPLKMVAASGERIRRASWRLLEVLAPFSESQEAEGLAA